MELSIIANTTILGDGCNHRVDFIDQDGNWVGELKNHSGTLECQVSIANKIVARKNQGAGYQGQCLLRAKKSSNSKAVIQL